MRLAIDKSNNLLETDLQFEVLQEYSSGGGRAEKITLGSLSLNLAEYVEGIDDSDQGIVRRYLMQDSKINSTLKIGICMKQIDGERGFVAPALKTAPVFGGIAGILGQEQGDGEDPGRKSISTPVSVHTAHTIIDMPSINRGRETGELQDMYRKSLAAYWAAQAGELPADECIEDLFSGGDGWGNKHVKQTSSNARQTLHPAHHPDGGLHGRENRLHSGERHHHRHESKLSQSSTHSVGHGLNHKWDDRDRDAAKRFIRSGIGATDEENDFISQAAHHSVFANMRNEYNEKHERKRGFRQAREVNEFSKRDDLVAWKLPGVNRETEESVNKV